MIEVSARMYGDATAYPRRTCSVNVIVCFEGGDEW